MNELDKYLDMYADAFGEGFPMYQAGRGRTDAETIEIIKRCIKAGKSVYELGIVTDDNDVQY